MLRRVGAMASASQCEKLILQQLAPAAMRARIDSTDDEAGPMVAMMVVYFMGPSRVRGWAKSNLDAQGSRGARWQTRVCLRRQPGQLADGVEHSRYDVRFARGPIARPIAGSTSHPTGRSVATN